MLFARKQLIATSQCSFAAPPAPNPPEIYPMLQAVDQSPEERIEYNEGQRENEAHLAIDPQ